MFKNQTGRNNFLLAGLGSIFVGILSITSFLSPSISNADPVRCEGLFKPSTTVISAETADSFWLRSAQISHSDAYTLALMEEIGKPEAQEPIYRQLIGPALWHYARFSVETGSTTDRVTLMINGIEADIARTQAAARPRSNDHIRPKVMTRAERDEASAVGHYGFIEGSRLPSTKSAAQKRNDSITAMIEQAQRAYRQSATSDPGADPIGLEYNRIKRQRMNEPSITKAEIDAMLESPVDFAIVYAQHTGLMGRSGQYGEFLSPFVDWKRPTLSAANFRALSDMVALARAANASLPDQRTADSLVLETLRQAFAPHLPIAP